MPDLETRLAMQAARGISALQAMDFIRDVMQDAQTSRDEAKIRYDLELRGIDHMAISAVRNAMNQYADRITALDLNDDENDDEGDD